MSVSNFAKRIRFTFAFYEILRLGDLDKFLSVLGKHSELMSFIKLKFHIFQFPRASLSFEKHVIGS